MKHGFSLVELSIVLVILGLLVGGVLTGQSLIRAAELRSVTTDFSKYQAAVFTFRDEYSALPGDMTNATSFWGAAHATPATCVTTIGTGTQTCDGDGNSRVYSSSATSNESFRFWQHLANAGLIEGSYSGVRDGTNSNSATTSNSPRGKISNSLWYIDDWGTMPGDGWSWWANMKYDNILQYGILMANSDPVGQVLRPEEAWNIDTKMDDGKPASGKLVIRGWPPCTTATSQSDYTAAYKLTVTSPECILVFRQLF